MLNLIENAEAILSEKQKPDDNERICVIGMYQYDELMKIEGFRQSDVFKYKNYEHSKKWIGVIWCLHENRPSPAALGDK